MCVVGRIRIAADAVRSEGFPEVLENVFFVSGVVCVRISVLEGPTHIQDHVK